MQRMRRLRSVVPHVPHDAGALLAEWLLYRWVMVDETIDTVREAIAAKDVTWPCFWDGPSGADRQDVLRSRLPDSLPDWRRWNVSSQPEYGLRMRLS